MENIFNPLPNAAAGEVFTPLLERPGVTIERIVSLGQVTQPDAPYVQTTDEWVVLIAGHARLKIEGREEEELTPGSHVFIPAQTPHWVIWTDPNQPCLWLAVHIG